MKLVGGHVYGAGDGWVFIRESEADVAKNAKQTSKKAASAASDVLKDGRTSKKSKTSAGSALSQAGGSKGKKKK